MTRPKPRLWPTFAPGLVAIREDDPDQEVFPKRPPFEIDEECARDPDYKDEETETEEDEIEEAEAVE